MDDDKRDEIRKQVEERNRLMAEKLAEIENGAGAGNSEDEKIVPRSFLLQCLNRGQYGDGILFAFLHHAESKTPYNKFAFNENAGNWLLHDRYRWVDDLGEKVLVAVENVTKQYINELDRVNRLLQNAYQKGDENEQANLKKLQKLLAKRIDALSKDYYRVGVVKCARTNDVVDMGIKAEKLDSDPNMLHHKGGKINLLTGKNFPTHPQDFNMKSCNVEYKEGISYDDFEKILLEIHNGNYEIVRFEQKLMGSSLFGKRKDDNLPIKQGKGRNGKTTYTNGLMYVLGDYAGPIPSELLLENRFRNSSGPTPDLMLLKGLRIAFASEVDQGRKISPAMVKLLTGGDQIVARNPHDKYPTKFSPSHSVQMLTNHIPHIDGDDFAFFERVLIIPYRIQFVDREPLDHNERRADKNIEDKLKAMGPNILAWLVDGAILYTQEGLHPIPEEVRIATKQYREDEDTLGEFLGIHCDQVEDGKTGASRLYGLYKDWFENYVGGKMISQHRFGRLMGLRFRKEKIGGIYYYYGLTLKQDL